ncbi:MAG: glycosyl transferase family 2 [Deltaproteobacteria bacterium]|nr:glycosyl transferase family 2 [Deltaproteobacteria bacterium]MBS1244241.1 glycosyl transferase family 2 [Deltaproteobacteria bacterium]
MVYRPLVSIVIPVYNGSDYLKEAIDSALAQTCPDVEVLVVNDGSDDGGRTEAIALSHGDGIRYFRKENGGVASALNLGIREMRGEYFSWLSHDDVYLPRKVEREVTVLEKCGRDAVVYSDYEVIDASSRLVEVFRAGRISAPQFRMLLVTDIPVNGCTVLLPRRCFEQSGLFDERLKASQDYDLWFRMARRYPFIHVPEVLLRSRMHAGQGTRRMTSTCLAEGNANFTKCLDEIALDQSPSPDPVLTRFFLRAAVRLKRRGYIPAAEHALSLYRRYAVTGFLTKALHGTLSDRYFAACDRPWATFLPRVAHAISDMENFGTRVRRRLRWGA